MHKFIKKKKIDIWGGGLTKFMDCVSLGEPTESAYIYIGVRVIKCCLTDFDYVSHEHSYAILLNQVIEYIGSMLIEVPSQSGNRIYRVHANRGLTFLPYILVVCTDIGWQASLLFWIPSVHVFMWYFVLWLWVGYCTFEPLPTKYIYIYRNRQECCLLEVLYLEIQYTMSYIKTLLNKAAIL